MIMKLIFLAAVILAVQSKTPIPSSKLIKYLMPQPPRVPVVDQSKSRAVVENFFVQRLDHFTPLNQATFNQRYLTNGDFFYPGGPLFVFVGGEWEVGPDLVTSGSSVFMELVEELRGYAFYLEHRYFGESIPQYIEELTTEELRYLSPDQALADIAYFITYIKQTYITVGAETSGVILVGAHYSGSLVTWFRQKYPSLVVGAWAAGAPVLAINDHSEFKELSGAVYRNVGGESCYNQLLNGFEQLEEYVEEGNTQVIQEMFHLCDPLDLEHPYESAAFFYVLSEVFSVLVQVEEEDELRDLCTYISDPNAETPAHGLANIVQPLLADDPDLCIPFGYDWFIELDRNTSLDSIAVQYGLRQFSFLICSSLGWYHSAASDFQPFGSSFQVDLLWAACGNVFGPQFNQTFVETQTLHTNILHGGLNVRLTNIIFSNGFNDPWRTISVQDQHNDDAPVFIIPGYSSYRELFATDVDDSLELSRAKLSIKGYIRRWILESNNIIVVPLEENTLNN